MDVDLRGQGNTYASFATFIGDQDSYEGKTVAVLGGGNSALQEAILLADLAKKVYVVQNLDTLTGEERLRERLYAKENVEVLLGSLITKLEGGEELSGIRILGKAIAFQSAVR